jgi:hypothetical protein
MKNVRVRDNKGLYLLDNIPYDVEAEGAASKFRIARDSEDYTAIENMVTEAKKAGSPKAVYRVSYPGKRTEDSVVIDGVVLKSRVLSVNLADVHRVFPYVVTCGRELEGWSKIYTDPLLSYFTDYIKAVALESAVNFLYGHIKKNYLLSKISSISPGSLDDWPLEQQKPLFEIMGDMEETAGVVLTDSLLMLPAKSMSGIIFPTDVTFESCMLCPREDCVGRRAPYNSSLYEERYKIT